MNDSVLYFLSFLTVVWDQSIYCLFCSSKPQVSHFSQSPVNLKHYSKQVLFWRITFYWTCGFLLVVDPHSQTSFLQLFTSPTVLLLFSVELASLLPKAGVGVGGSMDSDLGVIVDGPSAEDLGQSLVFTNSHHNGRTATHSYAHATANSYAHAASGGTTYAHAALVQLATHTHTYTCANTSHTHLFMWLHWCIVLDNSVLVLILSILPVLGSGLWFWLPECT